MRNLVRHQPWPRKEPRGTTEAGLVQCPAESTIPQRCWDQDLLFWSTNNFQGPLPLISPLKPKPVLTRILSLAKSVLDCCVPQLRSAQEPQGLWSHPSL
uniref:Uncharacterized protein n=1 Tax=Mus musculus TaxID=10090 RepID=Q3TEP5_MOUSE|nr:unnamed protein product [Mus musculus]